jgi:hypothetical protein
LLSRTTSPHVAHKRLQFFCFLCESGSWLIVSQKQIRSDPREEGSMPRGKQPTFLERFRIQATRALAALTNEIRRREADLQGLQKQAETWRAAILGGGGAAPKRTRAASSRRGTRKKPKGRPAKRGSRVSWDAVLASMPAKFGVDDVMKHPGARSKGRAQVYPALTRWVQAKKIRKVGKGRYQRA